MSTATRQSDLVTELARQMIESSLSRVRHLRAEDEAPGYGGEADVRETDIEVAVLFRRMYEEWARDAERVINRVKPLAALPEGAALAPGLEQLGHEYGRVRAMLSVSLESIAEARAQIARGEGLSPQEVRDALHPRARP